MKNFKIGKEIKRILSSDEQVNNVLGNKIFPLVAENGTLFPFLTYRRTSFVPYDNKDYTDESVYMDIMIVAQTYNESVDIADTVADCLNRTSTELINYIGIKNIREDYVEDSYVQTISIEILLN